MKTDGLRFLEALGSFPPQSSENRFSRLAIKLGLGGLLDRNELTLLYNASYCATACNLAINASHSQERGRILAENEAQRCQLENEFMLARDLLFASPGWQLLPDSVCARIERSFLTVSVQEHNLAW